MIKKTIYLCDESFMKKQGKTLHKQSYRGIIMSDAKLLMVYVSKIGDYRFPGGKAELGESGKEAACREINEEVGAIVTDCELFAHIKTKNLENFKEEFDYFEMDAYYYICNIEEELEIPSLSKSEIRDGYKREWISIQDAIRHNEEFLMKGNPSLATRRETEVLYILKDVFASINV